jgi:hypothetical protein|tara:strand:+ start:162 stop:383 length:222 start_codon:yes stop_codon:yes gene_type:complete
VETLHARFDNVFDFVMTGRLYDKVYLVLVAKEMVFVYVGLQMLLVLFIEFVKLFNDDKLVMMGMRLAKNGQYV